MKRLLISSLCLALASPLAMAQDMDHMHHHGEAATTDKPAKHDEHAGHQAAQKSDEHAHHQVMPKTDEHAGHDMSTMSSALPPNDHVPPPAPATELAPMSPEHMADMMQMHDLATRGMLLFDRLERTRSTRGDYATSWEAQGWYGGDIDRVWLRTEGERSAEGTHDARVDVLWSHAFSTFWDVQGGVRHDFGQGPSRDWLAVGVQGLAPYWFETQATFYAGDGGRTALRLEASYDLRFTQRLILAPELEANFYGKDDPLRGVRSGLSDVEAGLRLRYEFSRRFAPYVGVNWTRRFADATTRGGEPAHETTWLLGLRMWF